MIDPDIYIYSHSDSEYKKLEAENKKLREALEKLLKRHEWSQHFDQTCICEEHIHARTVLAKVKGD